MANFYCEYCGTKAASVQILVGGRCTKHPNGPSKGNHKLYEGSEKSQYTCKYCGMKYTSLQILCGGKCTKHPDGPFKGMHAPAL